MTHARPGSIRCRGGFPYLYKGGWHKTSVVPRGAKVKKLRGL